MSSVDLSLSGCYRSISELPPATFKQIAWLLGDQLHAGHSWWRQTDDSRLVVLAEMRQETDYVRHHRQKILAFFAAMRAFATALAKAGHRVLYLRLDAADNQQQLTANLAQVLAATGANEVYLQQPDEFRLEQQLQQWIEQQLDRLRVHWCDSEHFLTARDSLERWFGRDKGYLMEYFYRRVRKQTGYLMTADGKPEGGQWNFDKANRQRLPAAHTPPQPLLFANDLRALDALLDSAAVDSFGEVDAQHFIWPINRYQARQLLNYFVEHLLADFGRYQDAMTGRGWSLYHARLSFALNSKILTPKEVVEQALAAYRAQPERIDLAQIEGFVRQIIGWREFIRAIYWQHMPDYATLNHFNHQRPLPSYFWHGRTHMRCLQHSLQQSLEFAYAHHIQRLMVIGNFALLTGLHPDAVDAWYLGVYIDAIEWVEMPNTRGMSQFADGGIVASKPYIASGAYIHKMSDYCSDCHYQVAQKVGPRACPLNSLYWHFIEQHWQQLSANPRMALITKQWQQRDSKEKAALIAQAQLYLSQLEAL